MAAAAAAAAAGAIYARYVRVFREAGALDEAHARTLDELGLRGSLLFRSMVRRGEVVSCPRGYYLNLARVAERRRRMRKSALIILSVVLLAFAVLALFIALR